MKLALNFILLAFLLNVFKTNAIDWDFSNSDSENEKQYKIVCYYTNWAQYRPKPATYLPEDIDPNLCTHIIYAFGKINEQSELQAFEWNDESTDWAPGMYQRTINLKKKNKNLKILIAVGGWNHGSLAFSNMVSDDTKRKNFIIKAVEFLKKNGFDGLDLDWEYPANRDTEDRPDDKIYFTTLCKELKTAFKPHNLILTAAVAAGAKYINSGYELSEIHKYLDFINLMAYDLHGGWDNVTGHNAPLYIHQFDRDPTLSVDYAIKLWTASVPAEKMVLGLSAYGRSFKLKEGFESCPLTDTPVSGPGTSGKFSREAGFLTYYEVCEKIFKNNWKYIWNDQQKVPYAYSNEFSSNSEPIEWVGFDDVRSIEEKVKYILTKNLGGGMIWSLDMDDFSGTSCNQGKYPLLSVVNHYLNPRKTPIPKANIIWANNNNSQDKDKSEEPVFESSLIMTPSNPKLASSNGFFSSNNVFGLVQNNVLQIYKFCQCKNGTHKIPSNDQKDKFSFSVDCNLKIVNSGSQKESDPTKVTNKPGINTNIKPVDIEKEKENNNKKNTIWSIFDISSSAILNQSVISQTSNQLKIVCYFSNLFSTRNGAACIREDNLKSIASLCSHVIFSYAKIDSTTFDKLEAVHPDDLASYKMVTNLKNINPNIKTLLSIGSYKDGTMPFVKMSESIMKRKEFIRNSILFLKHFNFDGLEINWNLRNIDALLFNDANYILRAKSEFTKIAQQISDAFKPFDLILSAMVSGLNEIAVSSYEIGQIHRYFDFVSVFMFDFHEIPLKFKYSAHPSPLRSDNLQNSIESTINFWIQNGFPKEKLLVGVDLFARTFSLFRTHLHELGSTVNKQGNAGAYTKIAGILSYYEVCENLYKKNWTRKWINGQMVPYSMDNTDQIVFYEDPESISAKSNYVKSNKLGGISLFSIDNDDFSGIFCMQGKYPLTETVKEIFNT